MIKPYSEFQILPVIFSYLPSVSVLRCREVCKEWQYSVDNFFRDKTRWTSFDMMLGKTSLGLEKP